MVNTTRRKIQHFIARTTDKEIMKTFEWTSHPHRKEKTDGWMDGWLTDCWTMDWPTTLLLFVCVLFVLNPPRGFLFLFQGGRWRVSNYLYVYGLGGWGSKRQKEMNNREIESAGGRERESATKQKAAGIFRCMCSTRTTCTQTHSNTSLSKQQQNAELIRRFCEEFWYCFLPRCCFRIRCSKLINFSWIWYTLLLVDSPITELLPHHCHFLFFFPAASFFVYSVFLATNYCKSISYTYKSILCTFYAELTIDYFIHSLKCVFCNYFSLINQLFFLNEQNGCICAVPFTRTFAYLSWYKICW